MDNFLSQFHFLRPYWFFALIPVVLLFIALVKRHSISQTWQSIIDPKLLPHLLQGQPIRQSSSALLILLASVLILTALAGPAWEKRPQPVFKEKSALVIALDLSRSMDATDIKPSRLTRAKHKIIDILSQRTLGQTALLVYAANAYTVSPLTDDTDTIKTLLPSLETNMMPSQGSRADYAMTVATQLLSNAGIKQGDILFVTDGIDIDIGTLLNKNSANHRLSVLAVATPQGAPIQQQTGGFVKDSGGAIVVPKLSLTPLRKLASDSNGVLATISYDDTDINRLTRLFTSTRFTANADPRKLTLKTDSWYEQGPWLIIMAIPLIAIFFRRGIVFALVIIIFQQPIPADASTLWDSLWLNADQRAAKLLKDEKTKQAAELFSDKQWKASAYYKDKQYQKTIDSLKNIQTADARYNSGNAYAKLGKIEQAIQEYNSALLLNPEHKDAKYNKKLLLDKQKQQKNSSSDNKQDKQNPSNKTSKQQSGKDKKSNKGQHSKNNSGQNQSQQDSTKQNGPQADRRDQKHSRNAKDSNHSDTQNPEQKGTPKSEKKDKQQAKESKDKQQHSQSTNQTMQKSDSVKNQQSKQQQATRQWLRRIPDDPGGLLRNKFRYQYQQRDRHTNESNNW